MVKVTKKYYRGIAFKFFNCLIRDVLNNLNTATQSYMN